jgi:hypothetical protein
MNNSFEESIDNHARIVPMRSFEAAKLSIIFLAPFIGLQRTLIGGHARIEADSMIRCTRTDHALAPLH